MNEITLAGCTSTPLASYLKALGVLRLLSSKYPETRACWRGDKFVLHTNLDELEVNKFFLDDYEPTPIMAPWNGGSGFFDKDNKDAAHAIQASTSERFALYRQCIDVAETALNGFSRKESPKGEDKARLLMCIRASVPEAALGWFDAAVVLAGDSPQYPPLLGTGGNDGRLDFTNNFMQRLCEILTPNGDDIPAASTSWLRSALFGEASPNLVKKAIGQFSPGQAGGPNATAGFDADAAINPWDFVMMIEGALVFAAAAVRRNADDPTSILSYPFTVRAVGAGSGSLGEGDAASARGELWMPLWSQPASFAELRSLMAEGRVALGRKPARDALDFVRAVHHLGGYRGIKSFQRFGLLMRSGKAYLATPLSRVEVREEPQSNLLDELDKHGWLDRFRRFAQGEHVANRSRVLRKRLEDRLFGLSGHDPTKADMQSLLSLLGEIEQTLSTSTKAQESVQPVPHLTENWVIAADDGSPEFRIAKAVAGLRGVGEVALPLRAQLFPVHPRFDQWMTPEAGEEIRIHTGQMGQLVDTLCSVLTHRLHLAERLDMRDKEGRKDKPLTSPAGATLDDVTTFLQNSRMDARIAALLPGLGLCTIPKNVERTSGEGTLPAAFGLMKLALTPDRTLRDIRIKNTPLLSDAEHVPIPSGLVAQLASGNPGNQATRTAWRRLRSSGLAPLFPTSTALPTIAPRQARRAAAALLIPLRFAATASLARTLLAEPEAETTMTD